MSNLTIVLLASCAVFGWYGLGTVWLMRTHRLDPTLLTYLTPLRHKSYWVARLLILIVALALSLNVWQPVVLLTAALLAGFASAQILLLIAFGRTGTQPLAYYSLLALYGLAASAMADNIISRSLLLLMIAVQEIVLRHWLKHEAQHYNSWVQRKVKRVHRSYSHLTAELTTREWFYVLHFAVTESIARPRLSRWIERVYFYWKRPAAVSSGIMQVKADRLLSDAESMRRGSQIVCEALRRMPAELVEPLEQLKWLARAYNGSVDAQANTEYTGFLLATYPGLVAAWQGIGGAADG